MNTQDELNTPPYPTLDTTGWLIKPEPKADAVMLDYLQASYSQSVVFEGQIRSFQYTIQQNQGNVLLLERAVEDDLRAKFGAYFDLAEVRCNVRDLGAAYTGSDAKFDVEISVDVIQNGQRVSIGRMLSIANGQIISVAPLVVS